MATLSKQSKKGVTVTGKKKGTAVFKAKIKTKSKTYSKTLKVTVSKASTVPDTNQPATDVPVEKLIHYDMTCSEDGKKLLDKSGKGNDAELVGVDTEVQENQSLFLDAGAYIKLPENVFTGRDTFTVSIWLKSYSGSKNTSAMFVGSKETLPVSYWLLNPANPDGRMKSVMTNSVNAAQPWTTEAGISPSVAGQGVNGPVTTERVWNHYVTVITPENITGYYNGSFLF